METRKTVHELCISDIIGVTLAIWFLIGIAMTRIESTAFAVIDHYFDRQVAQEKP
jgi:hypothetical protein